MTDVYIDNFWSKMLVASKGINKIPTEYLKQAFNCRSTWAWITGRRGKELLTNSTLWTNNKWGFELGGTLYQITNSKVYSINLSDGVQTEIDDLWYDARTDVLVYGTNFAIIVSEWQALQVFDGISLTTPISVPWWDTWGIIEFINSNKWYTLYAINNILHISRPILNSNPEFAYDYIGAWSQEITYKTKIVGLKTTLNWVYIFTQDGRVEFIWSESLQDIAWSPAFISTLLGIWWEPVNNRSITASGDQLFYITKNRKINTVNYIPWTDKTAIGKLSSAPVIWVDELLKWIDSNQPSWEAFYNENDETIQFHVRTNNFQFNNVVLVYDIINTSWAVDTWKRYNYMVKFWPDYYWFSDLNSSIYKDDVWLSDAWVAIPFKIRTQTVNYGSVREKLFWGAIIAWGIWEQTTLTYQVLVDQQSVLREDISWTTAWIWSLWETWGEAIWEEPIWGEIDFVSTIQPFERLWDEWRIYQHWTSVEIEITSISQIQDFIIDMLWMRVEQTENIDIENKF